jgi:hypothetical protein
MTQNKVLLKLRHCPHPNAVVIRDSASRTDGTEINGVYNKMKVSEASNAMIIVELTLLQPGFVQHRFDYTRSAEHSLVAQEKSHRCLEV